jgi:hypothetical protein
VDRSSIRHRLKELGLTKRCCSKSPKSYMYSSSNCAPSKRSKRQRELAQRYQPVCNKKHLLTNGVAGQ